MKIKEILYTTDRNLLQPDINKIIDKYHSRAKKRKSNMGYHSMMAYPLRVTQSNEARGTCWHGYQQKGYKKKGNKMVPNCVKEEAAGVGIVTKQNATKDVPVGGEYMNVKKLSLGKGKPKKMENFADKKVKGKSRPGRVKRAGASCRGSVADLRAKARKYGGERGKMYHWCANMKSGRKKK